MTVESKMDQGRWKVKLDQNINNSSKFISAEAYKVIT